MAAETKIQWTQRTWNPIAGCSVVSPGCTNCYAMRRVAPRLAANPATPHYHGTVKPSKAGHTWTGKIGIAGDTKFLEPLRIKAPAMWFVNSTSDLFHENVPDEVIDRVFAVMALTASQPPSRQSRSTPLARHTFQVLTKRSARMREYVSRTYDAWHGNSELFANRFNAAMDRNYAWINDIDAMPWPLPNVWLGVSVEDQIRADERIPDLLATPAAIRFISAEPLLGPIQLDDMCDGFKFVDALRGNWWHDNPEGLNPISRGHEKLDWIIVGGESGSGARPMHPDWARDLRDQCAAAGVPYFFKQWGEYVGGTSEDMGDHLFFHAASGDFESGVIEAGDKFDWFDKDQAPDGPMWVKLGTKRAGRLLDGIEHNGMPEVQHG